MTAVCRTAGPPDRIKPTPDAENPYEIPSDNFFADGSGRGEDLGVRLPQPLVDQR